MSNELNISLFNKMDGCCTISVVYLPRGEEISKRTLGEMCQESTENRTPAPGYFL